MGGWCRVVREGIYRLVLPNPTSQNRDVGTRLPDVQLLAPETVCTNLLKLERKHPSGAKARDFIGHLSARLKSCPDAQSSMQPVLVPHLRIEMWGTRMFSFWLLAPDPTCCSGKILRNFHTARK